jgi:hypothetical protein
MSGNNWGSECALKILFLLLVGSLVGCSSLTQDEVNAKIYKCTEANMEYTIMQDYRGKPVDVICIRKHPNEK